ncbi:MAG: sodium:proton antiporter [Acidobacteriota bacterium]
MQLAMVLQAIPFALVLAGVALGPTLMRRTWRRRRSEILVTLCALALLGTMARAGPTAAIAQATEALVHQWMPFSALLLALYATGGGILVTGGPWGRPPGNALLLAIGTLLAGVLGTTGAVLVVVHPLLRANVHRRYRAHLIVFLILLVGNVGGASTPLGDPPLMAGFLQGVPFLWPLSALGPKMLVLAGILLAMFLVTDAWLGRGEMAPRSSPLRVRGLVNIVLAAIVVLLVAACGAIGESAVVPCGFAWLAIALVSSRITSRGIRARNRFSWEPMAEVLVIFAAIFITVPPVFALLQMPAGLAAAMDPSGLYWTTGVLSSILDNTPTYLIFTHLGGTTPAALAAAGDPRLAAIAAGAVFFGGLTYIGNAPNLMLRAIASHAGVRMPGFFRYAIIAGCAMAPGLFLIGCWVAR